MNANWFTQPRFDLGGASTEDIARQALDCLVDIGVAVPDDAESVSMRGHGIDDARHALDRLIADPAFCIVAQEAGLDPAGLRRVFDTERFDAVAIVLRIIIVVGRIANLPEAETLVRETIDAQAASFADLDREFPHIPSEGAEHG
ncbi:hypothetical protein [Acidiphilium acidophilum]|uniref:hypothetical protein n=1 Tax=Acidiphilium acidophilum TaxID=76588 RepID=UPI002E8E7915|nr:hypothetical protein [Acidiphilium acidophilum]